MPVVGVGVIVKFTQYLDRGPQRHGISLAVLSMAHTRYFHTAVELVNILNLTTWPNSFFRVAIISPSYPIYLQYNTLENAVRHMNLLRFCITNERKVDAGCVHTTVH